jgi:hypothetical protein
LLIYRAHGIERRTVSKRNTAVHRKGTMAMNTLSPQATEALRILRAIRKLPTSDATVAAERRATKNLSAPDLTTVALALQADEAGAQ